MRPGSRWRRNAGKKGNKGEPRRRLNSSPPYGVVNRTVAAAAPHPTPLSARRSVPIAPPQALELTTAPLALQAKLPRRPRRPRGAAAPGDGERCGDPRAQPLQCELSISGLRPRVLSNRRDARPAARHHPPLLLVAERARRRHVEHRLDPRGGDVRVLPARPG